MEMDVRENIQAPDFVTLDLYCDRVASAVGRLSVRVFRMPREEGQRLAEHLGRALQLTNILRDLDEDAGINRLYLPEEIPKRRWHRQAPIPKQSWPALLCLRFANGSWRWRAGVSRKLTRS